MKKITKTLVLFLTVVLFGAMLGKNMVYADVITEPEDDFYNSHASECIYNNDRCYAAKGTDGTTAGYTKPNGSINCKLDEGYVVSISYIYTSDGVEWGLCDNVDSIGCVWFKMADLTLGYDGTAFKEDFGDSFGDSVTVNVTQGTVIHFWSFPGSENINSSIEAFQDDEISCAYSYTDADGNVWGYIGYYYINNGWIFISDVSSTETPVNKELAAKEIAISTADTTANTLTDGINNTGEPQVHEVSTSNNIVIVICICVVIVVIVTLLIIRLVGRKKA